MLYRCSRGYLLLHSQDEHRLGTFRNDWTEWGGGWSDCHDSEAWHKAAIATEIGGSCCTPKEGRWGNGTVSGFSGTGG